MQTNIYVCMNLNKCMYAIKNYMSMLQAKTRAEFDVARPMPTLQLRDTNKNGIFFIITNK